MVLKHFSVFCQSDCLCVCVPERTAAIDGASGFWDILLYWNEWRAVLPDFVIEDSRARHAMRLLSCPFCETEKDNGKKEQKKKTRKDVEGDGELGAHGSGRRVPAGDYSHVSQQHRNQKSRHKLAVFRALGAATWRRRRNSLKMAAGRTSRLWFVGDRGKSLL